MGSAATTALDLKDVVVNEKTPKADDDGFFDASPGKGSPDALAI